MSYFDKPLGTKTSIVFTAFCIAALLGALALCQEHYLADLPDTFRDARHTRQNKSADSGESAAYGLPGLEPVAYDDSEDNPSEAWRPATRHYTADDMKPAQSLFTSFFNSFLQ